MTNELPVWQLILLAVVYLTDLVLIARLCRDEVRDWGNERPAQKTGHGGAPPAQLSRIARSIRRSGTSHMRATST